VEWRLGKEKFDKKPVMRAQVMVKFSSIALSVEEIMENSYLQWSHVSFAYGAPNISLFV
jgi:hypothetical protein